MADLKKRYEGGFTAIDGAQWGIEIWQMADEDWPSAEELVFPADQPCVIEWAETAKHEALCPSSCTLRVESPGDRSFVDLYSVEACQVQLRVTKDGADYWRGWLDSEFYEEPFERTRNYDVSLTFSDMGCWERQKYDLQGVQRVVAILWQAVAASMGNNGTPLSTSLVGSTFGANKSALWYLCVDSANFYDEEGEPMTIKDVVSGLLQPLGLRIVQGHGMWHLYDLHSLYGAEASEVVWSGKASTLGVDRVYSKVRVNWSAYRRSGNLLPEEAWGDDIETPVAVSALNSQLGVSSSGAQVYSYPTAPETISEGAANGEEFALWLRDDSEAMTLSQGAKCFRVVPKNGSETREGAALLWAGWAGQVSQSGGKVQVDALYKTNYGVSLATLCPSGSSNALSGAAAAVKFAEVRLDGVPAAQAGAYCLRLQMPMWLDFRPSPNLSDTDTADAADWLFSQAMRAFWKEGTKISAESPYDYSDYEGRPRNHVYLPVRVCFKADSDGKTYVWHNREVIEAAMSGSEWRPGTAKLGACMGYWGADSDSAEPVAWLDYCDQSVYNGKGLAAGVVTSSPMCSQWVDNSQAVPVMASSLSAQISGLPEGQIIPYPPYGSGTLWVEALNKGLITSPKADEARSLNQAQSNGMLPARLDNKYDPNFLLLGLPSLYLCNFAPFDMEISDDDQECVYDVNPAAEEELPIDAVMGMAEGGLSGARGAYLLANSIAALRGQQCEAVTRAGRTGTCFDLLAGTLYSQYAERRDKITGETEIDAGGLAPYTEPASPGKKFIMAAARQDLRMACQESTLIELRPDEYDKDI